MWYFVCILLSALLQEILRLNGGIKIQQFKINFNINMQLHEVIQSRQTLLRHFRSILHHSQEFFILDNGAAKNNLQQ